MKSFTYYFLVFLHIKPLNNRLTIMKKFNTTLAVVVFASFVMVMLSSCHRNSCPTFNKVEVESEVRA